MWCHIFIVIVVVLFFVCFLLLLFFYYFFGGGGSARFREFAYVYACVLQVSINKNVSSNGWHSGDRDF